MFSLVNNVNMIRFTTQDKFNIKYTKLQVYIFLIRGDNSGSFLFFLIRAQLSWDVWQTMSPLLQLQLGFESPTVLLDRRHTQYRVSGGTTLRVLIQEFFNQKTQSRSIRPE